jgi:signal recognition particle subunit SRP54
MKSMVTGMAGAGMGERMKMLNSLKDSALMNPGAKLSGPKKGTGKRLTTEEKNKLRKLREKELKKRKKNQ